MTWTCGLCTHTVSKETYYSVKRDLLHCQKRPTTYGLCTPHPHSARGIRGTVQVEGVDKEMEM